MREQLLAAEDMKYFLSIAQSPGQKPAPFIPVLDASFEVWFKKVRRSILESGSSLLELTDDVDTQNSLWVAEDIDAIFDRDPQRIAIMQGPVAVKHARVANRPIKEMLGGIKDYIVKKLLEKYYDNEESRVPYIDYVGSVPATINSTLASSYGINVTSDKISATYKSGSRLSPDPRPIDCELSFARRTSCRRAGTSRTLSNASSPLTQARLLPSSTTHLVHHLAFR